MGNLVKPTELSLGRVEDAYSLPTRTAYADLVVELDDEDDAREDNIGASNRRTTICSISSGVFPHLASSSTKFCRSAPLNGGGGGATGFATAPEVAGLRGSTMPHASQS